MTEADRVFDVAVIGAGETGRAAARAAAEAGAQVALIDDGEIDRTDVPSTVKTMSGTRAWGLFRGGEIGVIRGGETAVLRATSVVVATGARDAFIPFPQGDPAGVYGAGEAARLLATGDFPGKRVAIISDDPTPELDRRLAGAGSDVVARVTHDAFPTFRVSGGECVESVSVEGTRVAADAVIVVIGRQPDDALARMIGAVSLWRPELGGNVPLRDEWLRVNGGWCWVAGDAAGLVADPALGVAEGTLCGECAAHIALHVATDAVADRIAVFREANPDRVPASAEPRADDPFSIWLHGLKDETTVCRCEDIDAGHIRAAIGAGMRSINDVKRRTRAGMGACQGARCTRTIGTMLADAGVPELDPAPMTSRPPSGLVTVGELSRLTGV